MSRFSRLVIPECLKELPPVPARLTTGAIYQGNQMFTGRGVSLWCCKCHVHKATAGGKSIKRGPQRWFTCADCLHADEPVSEAA